MYHDVRFTLLYIYASTDLICVCILSEEMETIMHSNDPIAPVAFLKFHKLTSVEKVSFSNFEIDFSRDLPIRSYLRKFHLYLLFQSRDLLIFARNN